MDLLKSIEAFAYNHPSKLKRSRRYDFNSQQIIEELIRAQRNGIDIGKELEDAYYDVCRAIRID